MRSILLNPGPVSLSEGVRRAVVRVDLCHREPEFFDLQDQLIKGLLDIYQCDPAEWSAVLLGGSGTSAMEAMLASLLPRDTQLLVLENGVYGERLSKLASIYGISYQVLHVPWGDATDLGALVDLIDEIAAICAQHDVQLLLDAVSSFGAESIPFSSGALQAVAATANKCLHGIPGLAMVLCRRASLEQDIEPRSLSLHLPSWAEQQAKRSTPFTPAINAMLGLAQALQELGKQGGWRARRTRYRKLAKNVAATLAKLGVKAWLPATESSCVLRSYHLPQGLTYNQLHDGLKQHGFIIYAGQGDLVGQLFRISTMGEISNYDMARLEQALQSVIGD